MPDRRVEHRALQRNLILDAVRILLHSLPVVPNGGVPVAGPGSVLSSAERTPGAAAGDQRTRHEHCKQTDSTFDTSSMHHCPDSRIVWRPRPSMYESSISSGLIFNILYWPSTASPSLP